MNVKTLDRRVSALEGPVQASSAIKVVIPSPGMTAEAITALEAAARQEAGPHARIIAVRFVAPGEVPVT